MKENLSKFFLWIKDHFLFVLKVVLHFECKIEKKENPNNERSDENDK